MAEKIILFEANVNTDQAVKDTIRLKEELEILKNQAELARKQQGELSEEYIKYQAAIKSTQSEIKTQENLTQKLISANTEQSGTLTKLTAENAKLRQEQKGLNLETKEGIKRNSEINAKINDNTKFIKANSDTLVQNKMNVGNYADALSGMGSGLGSAAQGFMSMAKAALAFIATPIGAVIAAVALAVGAVASVFKKFEPVLEWFERKIAAVMAVVSVLKDVFLGFVTGTKSLSESFDGLGTSMANAAREAEALKKAQQDLEDQQILQIETEAKQKRQIDELLLQSKNRTLSEKERMDLIDQALKIEEAAYNKKKQLADDEYNQAVRQIAIDNQLTDEQEKNLKEQGAAYLQKLQETKAINDDEVKAFAELSAKRETILNESIAIREKAMNRQDALAEKLAAKEQKRIDKAKEEADKLLEKQTKDYEKNVAESERLNQQYLEADKQLIGLRRQMNIEAFEKGKEDRQKQRDWERYRLAIDLENEMQIRVLNNESMFEIQRDDLANRAAAELEQAEITGANIVEIQTKYSLAKREIDRQEMVAKISLQGDMAGKVAELFGKGTKIGKMAASASAAAQAVTGAMSAYAAAQFLPPPAGQIVGGINAGLSLALGVKSVKDIWAVKSGLPGDSGGGSTAIPTGGANVNPSIGNGIVSRSVSNNQSQVNVNTQPTLVIDDVTAKQQQQKRMNETQAI